MVPEGPEWPNFLKMLYSQRIDGSDAARHQHPRQLLFLHRVVDFISTQRSPSGYHLLPAPSKPSSGVTLPPHVTGGPWGSERVRGSPDVTEHRRRIPQLLPGMNKGVRYPQGIFFKREYYSSVLDNPSMTKLILPPDSFQLGGPDTPWDRGSPGLPSGCR